MSKRVAVLGAGIGGLSTAARLASRGYRVDVYEKLPECGGRNHLLEDKGFKFDTGPSFVLMPDFFEEVFSYCNRKLTDYMDLKVLDPGYKIYFSDGDVLTVHRDSERTKEELEKIEKGASHGFEGFIKETTRIYKRVRPLLGKCFTKKAVLNPDYWGLILQIRAFDSYWKLASKFFRSKKLRYAFTFEAMFMGVSPYDAPAFYSVISYADHVQKIYHPMGGMYRVPRALETLGKEFGVRYHYSTEVKKINPKKNGIALLVSGQEMNFDKVVVNADYAYANTDLLGKKIPDYKYSCSVYLIYLGLKKKVTGLAHHNLFFSSDLDKNLDQVFKDHIVPDEPSFYLHVPTVTDASLAPAGKDIFYILVPVPNLKKDKGVFFNCEKRLRSFVFDKISAQLGGRLEDLIEVEHSFYPEDFISRYNIKYGATFGLAHNLFQSAFFRPPNFDRKNRHLYFVGASTQPGGGLPVVIASSKIVSDLITGQNSC